MLNSVDAQSITLMMAGVVAIIIPSMVIFIVGQKQLISGMFQVQSKADLFTDMIYVNRKETAGFI